MWALVPLDETEVYTYKFKLSKMGGVIEHENELIYWYICNFYSNGINALCIPWKSSASNGTETSAYDVIVNNCWEMLIWKLNVYW